MPPSDVFHYEGLTYWGPTAAIRIEDLLDMIPLQKGDRVLDMGCGRGEVLLRLAEKYQARGVGVDRSAAALALARNAFAGRAPDIENEFVQVDAREFSADAESFAAVVAMGGPHLGQDVHESWKTLSGWVQRGGICSWERASGSSRLARVTWRSRVFQPMSWSRTRTILRWGGTWV